MGSSLCADELWLFIYSEVLGAFLSVLMSFFFYIFRGIRSTSLCAVWLWLFIYSELIGQFSQC